MTELATLTRRARRGSGLRRAKSAVASIGMVVSVVVVLVPLIAVVAYVIAKGSAVFSWGFLTGDIPIVDRFPGGGMGPAVIGTALITGAAALMAVPLGVLGGVWLHEYGGRGGIAWVLRLLSDVMTGVPSIVMGLFIYVVWVLNYGFSAFAGALALGCLMLPVVIRTTEEMLKLVPSDQREASYALGGRKASTILRIVLPAAAPGIVSGALLAVARAAGETAPLLFTILLVSSTNTSLFHGPNTALSTQIFRNAQSPFPGAQDRAWGAALALIILVFLFTIIARILSTLFARKHQS